VLVLYSLKRLFDHIFKEEVEALEDALESDEGARAESSLQAILILASVLTLITYVQTVSVIMKLQFRPTLFHSVAQRLTQPLSLDFLQLLAIECRYELSAGE
jgi:hypothetical protein